MKKFILGLFSGLLIAAIPISSASSVLKKTFNDVNEGDWFYEYVTSLATQGIIDGYSDGNFLPANYVNRAEASKLLYLVDEDLRNLIYENVAEIKNRLDLIEGQIDYLGVEFPGECYVNGTWYNIGETVLEVYTCEEGGRISSY